MSKVSESKVWDVLTHVHDPELEVDIVNLGLVYEVRIDGARVELTMTLTTIGCPAQDELEQTAKAAVRTVEGVEAVEVRWVFDPPWTPGRVTEEGRDLLMAMGYL